MSSRLAYDVHGEDGAPVVVLGSSLGTTRVMWDAQLAALAAHFRVVRYDHLGHGGSAVPDGPYTVPMLAAELVSLMDDLGIERAHHAGLSLGGMVAMELAATSPMRVHRLALFCTAAELGPAQGWYDRAETVRRKGIVAVADAVVQRWFTPPFADSPRAARLTAGLLDVPAEGYAGCCESIAEMDLRPRLGQISAPTLVVAGAQDLATPASYGQQIVEGVLAGGGRARLVVVQEAAHLAAVEQAERVTSLLLQHFGADSADADSAFDDGSPAPV